jgi:endonuclease/exonuclease/phosphatase family metal-dependent hydrolase
MDFFHDGGKTVRASEELSARYRSEIASFLAGMRDSVDFIMLQEVDRASKRSYFIDQMQVIGNELPGFYGAFAWNYKVSFVPVPFRIPYEPYGATNGGLVTFSKYRPLISYRIQYPGGFSWPTSLYMLDRCALEQHFKLSNNREMVLVNTHNTAYDETGEIKREEMQFIRERYSKASSGRKLVLLGGDWNQVPPDFVVNPRQKVAPGYTAQALDASLLPNDFVAIHDTAHTNRALLRPYKAGETFTTLIDYFIASPQLKVLHVKTINMDFRWSDHQPVLLTLSSR